MIAIALIALLLWFGVFHWLHRDVNEADGLSEQATNNLPTVIIGMRNEEKNIVACLESIHVQASPAGRIKVVLVDDHSEDQSLALAEQAKDGFPHLDLTIVRSNGEGKKAALMTGLSSIPHGDVFLTDADCQLSPNTLRAIYSARKAETKAVFGPVLYTYDSFWGRLCAYENLNTQIVTEALLRKGRPLMVNAANMLVTDAGRDDYEQALENGLVSGDDVFFAHTLTSNAYCLAYDQAAVVYTAPPPNLKALFSQRVRWVKKYSRYAGWFNRVFPACLFLLHFSFILTQLCWIMLPGWFNVFALCMVARWMLEWSYHSYWYKKYDARAGWLESLVLSVFYPWYYVIIGLLGQLGSSYAWKGRRVETA